MRRLGTTSVIAALGLLVAFAGTASASVRYSATTIGPVRLTQLSDISDDGLVVGTVFDRTTDKGSAISWQGGTITDLAHLAGGDNAQANGISSNGEFIAGQDVVGQTLHAVLWHNGQAQDLSPLPGGGFSGALAVNNLGVVVGISGIANCPAGDDCQHAVYWGRLGVVHDLGTLMGELNSFASGINDRGAIVGWSRTANGVQRPVVWRYHQIHELPTLGHVGRHQENFATDINSSGTIVGLAAKKDRGFRAVYWRHSRIHRLVMAKRADSIAYAINDKGSIVGDLLSLTNRRAVRWTPEHRLIRLTAATVTPGWVLTSALAINNHGAIVGDGIRKGKDQEYLLRRAPRTS